MEYTCFFIYFWFGKLFKKCLKFLFRSYFKTYSLIYQNDRSNARHSFQSCNIKILLNYIQTISVLNNLSLNWSNVLTKIFSVQNNIAGFIFKLINLDCFLKRNINFLFLIFIYFYLIQVTNYQTPYVFIQTLILTIFPFLIVNIFFLYTILKSFFDKKISLSNILNKSSVLLSISIYSLHSNILNSLFELIDCTELEDKLYLRVYMTIKCDDESYKTWIKFLFIPGFIFYAIILPLVCILYFYKIRNRIYARIEFKKIGFLIDGYHNNKYYW